MNKEEISGVTSLHSSSLAERKFSLWHYVWKLFRLRWVLWISGMKRARTRRKVGMAILAVFILSIAGLLFWGSWALLGLLKSPIVQQYTDPTAILESMPTLIVTIAFIATLLTNFGVLLQALYLAKDMDFLMSAPLPMRAVFITKMLQAVLPNFGLVCLFGLPVLFGLGASSQYPFIYYPLVILSLALLTLAAGGISGMLVITVARYVPAKRVAEVLGFVGVIVSVVFSQSSRMFNDVNLSNTQIISGMNTLMGANSPFSPLAWVGRGLIAIGHADYLSGLGLLAFSLGLAGGIFWLALTGAERLYYSGWANLQTSPRTKKKKRPAHLTATNGNESIGQAAILLGKPVSQRRLGSKLIPAPLQAVLRKDTLLIRRDLRNLSQLITPLIIGVLFVVSTARTGLVEGQFTGPLSAAGVNISFYASLVFTLFIGWSLMLSLTMGAFSREGKNYWLVKVSPITTRDLLLSKYFVAYIPSVLFELVLLTITIIFQRAPIELLPYGFGIAILYVAGGVGINLMFGIIGAKLDWQDPRQMNSTSMGCLGTLLSFIYLPVSIAFLLLPPVGFALLGLNQVLGQIVGLVLGGAVCLACAIVPPVLVRKRIERIGLK